VAAAASDDADTVAPVVYIVAAAARQKGIHGVS
jgi:hypothetical protein